MNLDSLAVILVTQWESTMIQLKSIHAGLSAIAVLAMPLVANAELITYSGTFDAEDPTFTVTAISGTWTAVVDDSDFLALTGVGVEKVLGTVTSLTMSPSPLGSTTFDTTNTGFSIDVTDGIVGNMVIGGLLDGHADGIRSADVDDWFANHFPGVNFSANGAPLDGVAAEAAWSTALESVNGNDSTHGGTISTASSALHGRLPLTPGGTDYQAVYDADRDITFLANGNAGAGSPFDDGANTTDGLMTWASANAWAASLTLGGYTDWRLPTSLQPDPTCSGQHDPGGGFPLRSFDFNCTGAELGHLFYNGLGGDPITSIFDTGDPAKLALFTNIPLRVWTSTTIADFPAGAWRFAFDFGEQNGADKTDFLSAWAVRDGDVSPLGPTPTVRMQLDATATSWFGAFSIIFDDTGDGLLQHEEIVFFSGVTGTSPTTGMEMSYSEIAYVPPIPGVSTASGTINPTTGCALCWEFTPSNLGDVSDGWLATLWTHAVSSLSELSQTLNFSYTFDGTDGFPRSAGATLSGQIQGVIQPDGDTVVIESFGPVMLTRTGLPDLTYASIEDDEFNAWPNVGEVPVMSFSGLKNNFRSCPEGFIAPFDDCAFGTSPGGGFLMSFDPSINMGSWATAADGTGDATCVGGGAQNGCRVQDRPINLANWSLTVEVPADECTTGCNPTGGHEIVLPDGFVVPTARTVRRRPDYSAAYLRLARI
jgi:hypothetical protein